MAILYMKFFLCISNYESPQPNLLLSKYDKCIFASPLFSESKPIPIINNKASRLHGYCSSFITNLLQTGFLLIIMHCLNFRHWLEAIYKQRRENQYKKTLEKIRTGKTIPLRLTRQKASSTLCSDLVQQKKTEHGWYFSRFGLKN